MKKVNIFQSVIEGAERAFFSRKKMAALTSGFFCFLRGQKDYPYAFPRFFKGLILLCKYDDLFLEIAKSFDHPRFNALDTGYKQKAGYFS